MRAKPAHAGRELRIARHRHPAFPRGDHLDRMKTEHGHVAVPARPDRLAAITPAHRVRCILDDPEPYSRDSAWMPCMSHAWPQRCTGITTFGSRPAGLAAASFSASAPTLML